ncbi:unnamed protein product [Candidula unifasciata]|uniref:Alpha-galactosidase n=1 Tax=Candidula unifasciata TaxID=100452 RepID=A0A8S3YYV0_9EUPU|nr:unnamed protein product [Candidula unifasciata]
MGITLFVCVVALVAQAVALDNGLARTPPMGWLSWQRFHCDRDCETDPQNCISENLYMTMADAMAANGYRDAGYQYVNIDDCWSAMERDPVTNRLVADPVRFPHGIKALADYIHGKGLKLGIYGDMGNKTCAGYPGSQFTLQLDAQTFAEWEVDSFKMDGCNSDPKLFDSLFPQMSVFLNQTGRPILFSCEWPMYQHRAGINPNYNLIAKYCNIWRNYNDISDTWVSVLNIIEFYGDNKGNFAQVSGPGAFNDPDQIVVGDPGLSASQQQVQMAMWAIFAAPLLVSSDLRDIDPVSRDLILNKGEVNFEVWVRRVLPQGSYAVAVLSLRGGGNKFPVSFSLSKLVPDARGKYTVTEVFTGTAVGTYSYNDTITAWVDVSSVVFRKYTSLS